MLEVRVKKGRGCNAPMHFCTYAYLHLCIFASLHFACLHYCNSAFLHPCNVSESSEREKRERYIVIYEKSGTSSYTKWAVHRQEQYIIIYETSYTKGAVHRQERYIIIYEKSGTSYTKEAVHHHIQKLEMSQKKSQGCDAPMHFCT